MLALLATSAAFAPSPQRLLTATLAGGWQLKLTELDPVTGAATDTLISVDYSKGTCKAPLNAPSLQMDSAIATVTEGHLFFLVQCQGVINSTVQSADHYLVVRTAGKAAAAVLGKTPSIYKDIGNSAHSPTLGWRPWSRRTTRPSSAASPARFSLAVPSAPTASSPTRSSSARQGPRTPRTMRPRGSGPPS